MPVDETPWSLTSNIGVKPNPPTLRLRSETKRYKLSTVSLSSPRDDQSFSRRDDHSETVPGPHCRSRPGDHRSRTINNEISPDIRWVKRDTADNGERHV